MTNLRQFSWLSFGLLLLSGMLLLTGCRSPDQGAGKIGPIKKWGVSVGDRVHSTPTVDAQGNVYVGSADHHLYVFSPKGKFRWKYKVDGLVKVQSPTVAKDGSVAFTTSDGHIIALDNDGRERWKYNPRRNLVACAPLITQGIVMTTGDLVLVAFRLKNGKAVKLGKKFPPIKGCLSQAPNGTIYFSDTKTLYAWKLENDKLTQLWSKTFKKARSLPGFDKDSNVYLGTEDGRIVALSSQGKELWTYKARKLNNPKMGLFNRPVVSPKGNILAVRFGDGLYSITPKGKKEWIFPEVERPFNGYITVAPDGMIYVGSWDYHVYAITPQGKRHYRFFTNDRVYFGGAISPDGSTLYIGSEDKHLYALHTHKKGVASTKSQAKPKTKPKTPKK